MDCCVLCLLVSSSEYQGYNFQPKCIGGVKQWRKRRMMENVKYGIHARRCLFQRRNCIYMFKQNEVCLFSLLTGERVHMDVLLCLFRIHAFI